MKFTKKGSTFTITLMLCLSMLLTVFSPIKPVLASSSPIVIQSAYPDSNGNITVYYQLTRNLTTSGLMAETSKIGYDYPATYRLPGVYVNTATTAGNYVMTIPSSAIVGRVTLNVKYQCYTYAETNYIKDIFEAPSGTFYKYYTVSTADAVAGFVLNYVAPGAVTTFYAPAGVAGKAMKIASATYYAWALTRAYQSATSWSSLPDLSAGQYYVTTQYYGSYTLNTTTQVYTNYSSYLNGIGPIFTGYGTDYF